MAISFRGNATGNSVQLLGCTFIWNRAASGGGVFIKFANTSIGNCVTMDSKTLFQENKCPTTATAPSVEGGGICITSGLDSKPVNDSSIVGNSVSVSGEFKSNTAENGAGGAISYTPAYEKNSYPITVTIVDCYFYDNHALVGGAVHLEIHPPFEWGIVSFVIIENSTFYLNSIEYASYASDGAGIGVVYSSRVPLEFRSTVNFMDNYGTALALVSTRAIFYNSTLTFVNNSGDTGGAIAFLSSSYAVVSSTTSMHFENNFAQKGGAIYNLFAAQGDISANTACFIRYSHPLTDKRDWKANFTFIDNMSMDHKCSSIFSTSVYPCADRNRESSSKLSNFLMFCTNPNWDFGANSNCTSEIETEGDMYTLVNDTAIIAYPGHSLMLPIEVRDDLGHNITDSVGYTSTVHTSTPDAQVDPRFKFISNNFIVITGQENSTVKITLKSAGYRPHYIQIEVKLLKCPPGFHSSSRDNSTEKKIGQCDCSLSHNYSNKLKCSVKNFKGEAKIVWNYWIGSTDQSGKNLVMNNIPEMFLTVPKTTNISIFQRRMMNWTRQCVAS